MDPSISFTIFPLARVSRASIVLNLVAKQLCSHVNDQKAGTPKINIF